LRITNQFQNKGGEIKKEQKKGYCALYPPIHSFSSDSKVNDEVHISYNMRNLIN
jgi:hypothetical protein